MTKAEKLSQHIDRASVEISNIESAIEIVINVLEFHEDENNESGAFYILHMVAKRLEELEIELIDARLDAKDDKDDEIPFLDPAGRWKNE